MGRGAAVALLLASVLVIMVGVAAPAWAASPTTAKIHFSGSHVIPAGAGQVRRIPIQSEGLPPLVPGVSAIPSGARKATSASTIFYDGFEGSRADWTTASGTHPTWAFVSGGASRVYSGQWSAYCAGDTGSGYNYPPGPYYNNMNAWLEAGPFNLSGVSAATFAYKLWCSTETNADYVKALVSIDGTNFSGLQYSGSTGGWADRSIDLTNVPNMGNVCGHSQVWIAFVFTSDSSVTGEGAYVDEVSITGSSGSPDDDIPGVAIPSSPFGGSLSSTSDYDDVFHIGLTAGQTMTASITGPSGSDFRLYLYAPGTATVKNPDTPFVASATQGNYPRSFSFTPTQSGTYYLDAYAETGAGSYTVSYSVTSPGGGDVGMVLTPDRSTVPFAGSVNFTGDLMSASTGSPIPNRQVGLAWSQEDKILGTWHPLGTYTSSTGHYTMTASNIQRLTYFDMVFLGDGQYSAGVSNLVRITAKAKLTPPAVPSRVPAGVKITSWGTLRPVHTAEQNRSSHTQVVVQRLSSGRWRTVVSLFAQKYRNTSTETLYSIALRYAPGQWRMSAVHSDSDHVRTTSSWRYFTVY